jgi:putative aminopeptidase FrvX
VEEMYIDIGADSREEAHRRGVEIGTPIVWNTQPVELGNSYVATAAADDRAGLAAMITIARSLSDKPIPATVYYVGTVEEEIGLRGAEVAVHGLDVDAAVAIDTCSAGYQPDVDMRDIFYEVGKGPAIHIAELGSRTRLGSQVLRKWLVGVAEKNGIPYQTGLMHGGTDASAIQQTGSGVAAVSIGVPRRYSHSPVEVMSLDDLHNLTEVVTRAVEGLTSDFSAHRI